MKKAVIMFMSLVAMMAASMSLKAQEINVELILGWNWIGYPNAVSLDIDSAMGGFTPMEGDIIKSQWSSSTYLNGHWRGGVTHLIPGTGYMYYSSRVETVVFAFAQASNYTVATATPTDVTAVSATVGSTITIEEGNHIFARGVCWGTDAMPTVDGSHTSGESVAGSQTVTLDGLSPSTTYYVRAYAVSDHGLAYGNEVSFNTIPIWTIEATPNPTQGGTITGAGDYEQNAVCTLTAIANEGYFFVNWAENGMVVSTDATYTFTVEASRTLVANFNLDHAYVDLGLPSGLLWATCNLGAETPEDYGDYFAWGETQPKDYYDWSNYQYCNGGSHTLTKYCNNASFGYQGFTDNLTILQPEDDAATANWGSDWRMPTEEEFQELFDNTTVTDFILNGVEGCLFTASNGNSLFFPYEGLSCWSSSLAVLDPSYAFFFEPFAVSYSDDGNRYYGQPVRAVRSGQNTAPTGAIDGLFSVSGSRQVYFSQGNLQYQASTNIWRFAEHQYDYIGSTNKNISSTYSGWIDLFGWGTSGYHDSIDDYNVRYLPWSSGTSTVNTSYNYYGYGPSTNIASPNLTGNSVNYDWGVYKPISNGGNIANQWRVLTKSEWNYVFNTRTTASGIRYAKAKVNNVNGVILLPDDWNSNIYELSNTNTASANYNSNNISSTEWTTIFESAGAVFLPAAGIRSGTTVYAVGYDAFYWSSAHANSYNSYALYFYDTVLYTKDYYRYYGLSVRLVRIAEN